MKLEKNKIIVFITFILSLFLFNNCSKDFDFGDLKVAVKTNNFSNVLQTTASVSGEIIRDNGLSINSRGICYGTTSNPTIAGKVEEALKEINEEAKAKGAAPGREPRLLR